MSSVKILEIRSSHYYIMLLRVGYFDLTSLVLTSNFLLGAY